MSSIIKRIRRIPKDLGMGEGVFETSIGVSIGYLNITEKRNGDPGISLVKHISECYAEYSLNWIITGEGPMKLTDLHILNEERAVYLKQSSKVEKSLIDLIKEVITQEVDPKLEQLNDSVLRLLKRDMKLINATEVKKSDNA